MVHDDADGAGPTLVTGRVLVDRQTLPDFREEAAAPSSGQGRVLVVEPQEGRTASLLSGVGFQVHAVDDGVTATQWLATSHFDAVVTEVSMPSLSGLELLRYAHEHDPDLPVLLMTGEPDVETASQAIEDGAFQYLLKPVRPDRLITAVEKAVAERRSARAKSDALQMLEDLQTEITERGPDRARFDAALASLWMAYQPIFMPDGALFAYEALVRSDEPDLRTAGDLLDAAERLNAFAELGRVVRAKTGRFVAESRPDWTLFVNLHAHDFLDELLVHPEAPLSRIAPGVVLEITERAALHDVDEVRERMAQLRSMGFRIALDDLGAGYAGLTSFAMLQPEIVKLDMGLVRDIDKEPVKRKLVGSVTQLARDMGILVVGEGVETTAERDVLIELGCHLLQGFLLGRPERF